MIDCLLLNHLLEKLKSRQLQDKFAYVVFAESLTGGLLSSELTKIPGASQVFWGGYVVYNPVAKQKLLGVPSSIIEKGMVSEECALSMAKGALRVSFDISNIYPRYSLAVTGIAGPPSQFDERPVGTVYIAVAKILNVAKTFDVSSATISDVASAEALTTGSYTSCYHTPFSYSCPHSVLTARKEGELCFYTDVKLFHFAGDRNSVREQTLNSGIQMLIDIV